MSLRHLFLLIPCVLGSGPGPAAFDRKFVFNGSFEQRFTLKQGETAEISAGLSAPSQLPPNARIAVEWSGYRKVLHALDPDIYFVFRAPQTGDYTLKMTSVTDEDPIFNIQ